MSGSRYGYRRVLSAVGALTLCAFSACAGGGETATGPGPATTPASVRLDFSACPSQARPLWVAVQDGMGAWSPLTGTGGVYNATFTSSTAGIALVGGPPPVVINVFRRTRAELAELADLLTTICRPLAAKTKSVGATVAGLGQSDQAELWLGLAYARPFGNGPLTFTQMLEGPQDLFAYRSRYVQPLHQSDRMIIRRDQNVVSGGSIGLIDFNSPEAVLPASGVMTVTGLLPADTLSHEMWVSFGTSCVEAELFNVDAKQAASVPTFTAYGIPASVARATDLHSQTVFAAAGSAVRIINENFREVGNRTVALPTPLPAPAITTLAGSYTRVQALVSIPTEFQYVIFYSSLSGGVTGLVNATTGVVGFSNVALAVPDFAGVAGWSSSWALQSTTTPRWSLEAASSNRTTAQTCFPGAYGKYSAVTSAFFAAGLSVRDGHALLRAQAFSHRKAQ